MAKLIKKHISAIEIYFNDHYLQVLKQEYPTILYKLQDHKYPIPNYDKFSELMKVFVGSQNMKQLKYQLFIKYEIEPLCYALCISLNYMLDNDLLEIKHEMLFGRIFWGLIKVFQRIINVNINQNYSQ